MSSHNVVLTGSHVFIFFRTWQPSEWPNQATVRRSQWRSASWASLNGFLITFLWEMFYLHCNIHEMQLFTDLLYCSFWTTGVSQVIDTATANQQHTKSKGILTNCICSSVSVHVCLLLLSRIWRSGWVWLDCLSTTRDYVTMATTPSLLSKTSPGRTCRR